MAQVAPPDEPAANDSPAASHCDGPAACYCDAPSTLQCDALSAQDGDSSEQEYGSLAHVSPLARALPPEQPYALHYSVGSSSSHAKDWRLYSPGDTL